METLRSKADAVRAAVGSTLTCTSTTSIILTELLLPKTDPRIAKAAISRKDTQRPVANKSKAGTTKFRKQKATLEEVTHAEEQLSPKQRSILATEVINAALKSLSDGLKVPLPSQIRKQISKDLIKTTARKTLRRSNSLPQSPLQPRSLNRVASSPNIANRPSRSPSISSTNGNAYRGTAECARAAFACLRALQAAKTPGLELPPLQLENGMSVLIGKLISHGLDELATKELQILKRMLATEEVRKKVLGQKSTLASSPDLAELLDFGKAAFIGPKLGLVISFQLQVLRLMATSKWPKYIEVALAILRAEHSSSPTRLLLEAVKQSKDQKQTDKLIRQIQCLAEILLSLCPSVSLSEDSLVLEGRLSISPETAIQLQTIALHNRFLWWGIAGHHGDLSKEIFDPFYRCLSAFARRSQACSSQTYSIARDCWQHLNTIVLDCSNTRLQSLKLLLIETWRLLGSLAKEAGNIDVAISFTAQAHQLLQPDVDSDAKCAAAVARLVSLRLQRAEREALDEELLFSLLESLEGPFKGASSEVDELMTEVSHARRSAINLLAQHRQSTEAHASERLSDGVRQMCESLVFVCPRLSMRYIGNAPDVKSATKDIVRYEQRRHFMAKSAMQAVDSALFLLKVLLAESRFTWDLVDSKLQDCTSLLDRLNLDSSNSSQNEHLGTSYYIRISNLFYSQYLNMKQSPESTKEAFRALRKSIDCIRSRSAQDRRAAQFLMKLERLAELYKASTRYDDLLQTLLDIRDEYIADGVLASVAQRARSTPLSVAWNEGRDATALGRTVQSLVKVQLKYLSSANQVYLVDDTWTEEERGTVLEQQLEMLIDQTSVSETFTNVQNKVFEELLKVYRKDAYPVRRLRVLLSIESTDQGKLNDTLLKALNELTAPGLSQSEIMGTADEALANYFAHLSHLVITTKELQEARPSVEVLKNSLSAWSSIRRSCENINAFTNRIDDVPGLIAHLQTISDWLQVHSLLDTRLVTLRLITDIHELRDEPSKFDDLVLSLSSLVVQWLQLGYSGKASLVLDRATSHANRDEVSSYARICLHLSQCQYSIATGSFEAAEEHLALAQALYTNEKESIARYGHSSLIKSKLRMSLLMSEACNLYSKISVERGGVQIALTHGKQSVRLLRRAWGTVEEQIRRATGAVSGIASDADKLVNDFSQLSMHQNHQLTDNALFHDNGDSFWALAAPLFHGLTYLSDLFAHYGLLQETIYYAEQARKIARLLRSDGLLAIAETILGSALLRSGSLDRGSQLLKSAKEFYSESIRSLDAATLLYNHGKMQGRIGDNEAELLAYTQAMTILDFLMKDDVIEGLDNFAGLPDEVDAKLSKLTLTQKKSSAAQKPSRIKSAAKGKSTVRAKVPVEVVCSVSPGCHQLMSLRAGLLLERARVLTATQSSAEGLNLLQQAALIANSTSDHVNQDLAMARYLLLQSMEQMVADPVYSVLQDSTISFPSAVGIAKLQGDRLSANKATPPKKGGAKDRGQSRSPVPDSFFDKLCQAQDHLTEALSSAMVAAPLAVAHRASALLNNVSILLSASGQVKGKSIAHPGLASSSIETTRSLVMRQEQMAIQSDTASSSKDETVWPQISCEHRRSSLGAVNDISRFQRDLVDIIPKPWTVLSISLGESHQELSITRLQAGHSPFVLRLPLGRHNSMDADEEIFGFEQGRTELREIIGLANESAHSSKSRESREAKLAWWEERETLDARLRDLLGNIEKVWLGGFIGMFSQHTRRPGLLARFQKSFQCILDKHLPSRQKTKKRSTSPRISLDSRILDLFIGLGDATDEEADFSEPLTDLLYFVVDVLQFHGELNAYAEIDFDSIVVETTDALRSYYEAVYSSGQEEEGRHTILVLDKALHGFPWESLPCMNGHAVSRLPSLSCLRERLMTQAGPTTDGRRQGHYIQRENGSYILNPSGDLKNTQSTFQNSLQSLKGWDGITSRDPSEDEFRTSLYEKELLLYFGHGSGAQYIRAREIKKLKKCAVTVLMGCSSGALVETGEFEPYGTPINYMHAGCHAMVATLWDVTDKDIDKFAKATFESWGLWEAETMGHKKGKKRAELQKGKESVSLVEAVAQSRGACRLRYLNAASVCVYGIPVYLE